MRNLLAAVILVVISFMTICASQAQEHDIVWVWNAKCPAPTNVTLDVSLDGKTVYATTLRLCRWERQFENGKASFRFVPKRTLIWYGYRSDEENGKVDPGDPTPAGTPLQVDFWQAGGESDAIELGYDVTAGNVIHMNSIHILSPTETSTTIMAPGLVLKTWPIGKPQHK